MKLKTSTLLLAGLITGSLALSSCGGGDKTDDKAPAAGGDAKPAAAPAAGGDAKPASAAPSADPAAPPAGVPAGDLIDITPNYPKPMFVGTPVPTGNIANLEKPDPEAVKKRLTFKLPKGTENLAKGKKVTSSDPLPIIGSLDLVTDGDADGADGNYVELQPGHQWVQIDLGSEATIYKLLVWHFHKQTAVYFNVNIQISNDPEFKTGVTSIFNNDIEDKEKMGKGIDPAYVETNHGRLIDAKSTKGRYVRLWTDGNSANDMNHYVEVQVYGVPAK